jgi:hypothetical protein
MRSPETPFASPAGENLRRHYVRRLERLVRLRRDFQDDLNPLGLELLEKSIRATYSDCVANGAEGAARSLVSRLH